ncbi:heme lyase CcmF/NrfE family subunit [Glacieibacterium frigidum]|uniref:Heme lyase CcmF/NrfE family subunit n=1 Tax=Glacieibacterium frigidum TaxID=2593303 RepID=A0A552U9E0_9SPHN|nr:heme lyase CcmF/NrfE family subunit [Glacieibacterium frigidum]TRW14833.1 heme lyase CcmF/NrfE family subunit [Glacieibacterium frigidum]
MTAEIGHFALILALLLSCLQASVPMWGAHRGDSALIGFGRTAAQLQALLIAVSFVALANSFVAGDFSVALVAGHSNATQPGIYRFAATWGNHEGSMLLWVLILAVFGAGLARFPGNIREALLARTLAVQGMIGAAFIAFLLFTSNPFERLSPAPFDGRELNPLLQDPGLVLHPPLLYLGYVGFSVAFSFAAAALIEGRVDAAWARWVRPWILAAWVCLTAGIALGSFWAYYELGWGGWWFWDPVENASLMPWLMGTALLHSALVLERRGALVSWTILLAVLTFSMSLIGTFLVRSGILTSVHAFAVDPERGVFILALIIGATGGALGLFAWRAPAMKSGALFGSVSRETGLSLNNLFLMAATAVVFLGTFYPVIMEAVNGDKISVGPPYYNLTFAPVMIPLLLLVTIGPVLQWKRDSLRSVFGKVRWPAIVALGTGVAAIVFLGGKSVLAGIGFALAVWLIVGAFIVPWRRRHLLRTTPMSVVGMVIAHAGLGVMTAGVTAMSGFETSKVLVMRPGDTATLRDARFTLSAVDAVRGPNYEAQRAQFSVRQGNTIRDLTSERRFYPNSQNQTTEAGIGGGILGNVYVAIGAPDPGGVGITVRIYHHPLVGWIWGGALLMALGGIASLSDRRFRIGVGASARPLAPTMPGAFGVPAE